MIVDDKHTRARSEESHDDNIYRPPKVAPMPYNETSVKEKRRARVPTALSSLAYQNGNDPHLESTSGLGGGGNKGMASTSARARELARMNEYEESNMTRLVLNKKEAKKRRLDEENIALGGTGLGSHSGRGRARGAGLADEFGDLLRAREPRVGMTDEYEDLRARSKKKDAFERSKARQMPDREEDNGDDRPRKRTKFHQEIKKSKKRQR
jgi:U3 small nucleolar ribonucleoprotein protein LCP5